MAGKTIHVFGIALLYFLAFFPAVAGVAGHTFVLVALRANAEVVDLVDLADCHGIIAPGDII